MNRFSVAMYVHQSIHDSKGKLTPIQVIAEDREDAQEKAIDNCESNGVITGNIVSIVKIRN